VHGAMVYVIVSMVKVDSWKQYILRLYLCAKFIPEVTNLGLVVRLFLDAKVNLYGKASRNAALLA
jgi:hypothetical protein